MKPATDIGVATIPQAVDKLFAVKLSKYNKFKNSIYTLIRREKLFSTVKEEIVQRDSIKIRRKDFTTFYNAILIQAIFPKPKTIEEIFDISVKRRELVNWAKSILLNQQTIVGVGLISDDLMTFFERLENDIDLKKECLPNLFMKLPQTQNNGDFSLCEVFIAQVSSLSETDSMMAYFLKGDLEKAAQCAKKMQSEHPFFLQYRDMILDTYKQAKEFDDLLEDWRN